MSTGGLHNNRPQYGIVHHPYDPSVEDDDGFLVQRDLPAVGRIAWAQESGSAGWLEACVDTEPDSARYGGGTWPEIQLALPAELDVQVNQDGDLDNTLRVAGARRIISQRTSEIESGVCLIELTIEIEENGNAADIFVYVDTDEAGWEWTSASTTEDYPVGTFRIPGKACGWVWAVATSGVSPIQLMLVDANDVNIGDVAGAGVELEDGDRLMIEGQLLYVGYPALESA